MKIWNAFVQPATTAFAVVALGLVFTGNTAIALQSSGNPLRGAEDHAARAAQQFLPSIEQLEVATASATVPSRDLSTAPTGELANWFLKSESTNTSKSADAATSSTSPFRGVESLQLPATFKKIAINTLIAVTLGVFFIVIVRRRHLGPKKSKAVDRAALAIEQSISLGGKSELKVIRYGQHQVMVAMDGSGIKSVVSLTPAFDSAMQMVEPPYEVDQPAPEKEPVNVEQFVNMIKQMESAYSSGNTRRSTTT